MIIELTIPDKRLMLSEYENPKYTIKDVPDIFFSTVGSVLFFSPSHPKPCKNKNSKSGWSVLQNRAKPRLSDDWPIASAPNTHRR